MKKKKLNKAVLEDRRAHIAYNKQFNQQAKQVQDRRQEHERKVS